MAGEVLEKRVLLVTASSSTYPSTEQEAATTLAGSLGLPHRVIVSEETEIPGFSDNPPDRCYYCKKELFSKISAIAADEGFEAVFDGSNANDAKDYRPGRRALAELGIVSPLFEAGLTKTEIRRLSRERELPTADKPSYACLASRFPYGEKITGEKLIRINLAEAGLRALGSVSSGCAVMATARASKSLPKHWKRRGPGGARLARSVKKPDSSLLPSMLKVSDRRHERGPAAAVKWRRYYIFIFNNKLAESFHIKH